eukprot:1508342-Alexandrium_andersonii.AAC.1
MTGSVAPTGVLVLSPRKLRLLQGRTFTDRCKFRDRVRMLRVVRAIDHYHPSSHGAYYHDGA